jgi:hypothetical protein
MHRICMFLLHKPYIVHTAVLMSHLIIIIMITQHARLEWNMNVQMLYFDSTVNCYSKLEYQYNCIR